MASSPDSLRRKVEAGERLTPDELAALEREAARSTGPGWRLALAHAYVELDQERVALGLLERLRAEFPHEVQVLLGLSRALFGLERFAEAQAVLEEALRKNPGDPEAEKALAILALRRGEFVRARALVEGVIRKDPLDDDARLLREELDAQVPPPAREVALLPAFTRALEEELQRRGHRWLQREGALMLEVGRKWLRVNLGSLHAGFVAHPKPLAEAVAEIAADLERSVAPSRALPLVRSRAFVDQTPGLLWREGPAGTAIVYADEDPELLRYVPRDAIDPGALAEFDAAAFERLATTPVRAVAIDQGRLVVSPISTGLWALAQGDGHDAARLLLAPQRARIAEAAGSGPWRVSLGSRDWVLLCRADDARGSAALDAVPPSDGVSGRFTLDSNGALHRAE